MKKQIMTLILALTTVLSANAGVLSAEYDQATGNVLMEVEIDQACNQRWFSFELKYCARRIDGPCYYELRQVSTQMYCGDQTAVVQVELPAPKAPGMTLILQDGDKQFVLQAHRFEREDQNESPQ